MRRIRIVVAGFMFFGLSSPPFPSHLARAGDFVKIGSRAMCVRSMNKCFERDVRLLDEFFFVPEKPFQTLIRFCGGQKFSLSSKPFPRFAAILCWTFLNLRDFRNVPISATFRCQIRVLNIRANTVINAGINASAFKRRALFAHSIDCMELRRLARRKKNAGMRESAFRRLCF